MTARAEASSATGSRRARKRERRSSISASAGSAMLRYSSITASTLPRPDHRHHRRPRPNRSPTLRAVETDPGTVSFRNVLAVLAVLGVDEAVATAINPAMSERGQALLTAAARGELR